ncbi:hypothetical protein ACFL1O_00680 [Patescibacteria group bacterium]
MNEEKLRIAKRARQILEKRGFFTGGGGCTLQPNQILDVVSAFEKAKKELDPEVADEKIAEQKKRNVGKNSILKYD